MFVMMQLRLMTILLKGEDSNFQFDGDFDSVEDASESMSDEDEDDGAGRQVVIDQSPYRFMNGNDGMGMLFC